MLNTRPSISPLPAWRAEPVKSDSHVSPPHYTNIYKNKIIKLKDMLRNIFLVNCLKELKECQKYILSNKIENYSFVALSRSSLVELKKKKIPNS